MATNDKDRHREYMKKWRAENPDKHRTAQNKYTNNNRKQTNEYYRGRTYKKYGLTVKEVNQTLVDQDNKCACCESEITLEASPKVTAFLDHCHTTNKARGLLCNLCNNALGFVKDNKRTLQNMIKYLERHGDGHFG